MASGLSPVPLGKYDCTSGNDSGSANGMLNIKSTDGTTIEGVLHKPADFQPGTKYPLLVVVHGGPTSSSPKRYSGQIAFFTSRGIGVVDVDHAGRRFEHRAHRTRHRLAQTESALAQRSHEAEPNAGEKADTIDPEHRNLGDRSIVGGVDLRLLPSPPEEDGAAADHEKV